MENLQHSRHSGRVSRKDCTGDGNATLGGAQTRHGNFSGVPHKLLNPSLSPRVEDYSEIFGSFSSRASSIPVLDLPEVDEAELYFDVRSSGFDYSEVFGDFDGFDFAPSYEDLFGQSMGVNAADCSSDEAWTPVETESMSEEFDHFGKDPCFSIEDPNHSFGGSTEFAISYNKADQSIGEELSNELRHKVQVQAIPRSTFLVDQTNPLPKTVSKSSSLSLADNNSHNREHNGETMGVKQFRKVMSHPHHASDGRETFGTDLGPQRGYGIEGYRSKGFISISEISLQTEPSHLPPPSRPPPLLDVKKGDASRNCKSSNSDGTAGCSPPFFDVEVDASSSAATSAAAMKKAMKKAQAKMISAKEVMERKKEGFQGDTKPDLKNSVCNEERYLAKRSAEVKCGRRSLSSQGSGKIDDADEWLDLETTQFFELVRTDKPRKAERQTNEEQILVHNLKVFEHGPKENRAAMKTYEQPEENGKKTKSLRQEYELEEKKLKVAEEVSNLEENNGRPKAAKDRHKLKEHEKKVKMAQEVHEREETEMNFGMAQLHIETQKVDGAARSENFVEVQQNFEVEQAKRNKERELKLKGARKRENDIKTKDIHKSESCEIKHREAFDQENIEKRVKEGLWQGGNEKFKDTIKTEEKKKLKESCERAENEKRWVEALQQVESDNRLQGGFQLGEDEMKLQEAHEWKEKERRQRKVREREEKEQRPKEAHEREENEKKLREAREWEDKERRQRKAREREENEKKLKVAHEREENEKKLREAREREDKERRQRKACEREENEKRLKVPREREENEKKPETREWEDKERIQRKAREREEKERRLKEAHEREENEKKLMEASEWRGKERRQKKAREREENENKLKGTHERKENEKRLIEACEKEESEKRLKQAGREREENERRLKFAREREEYEKRRKEAWEREENETTCKEALERKENEKRWREALEQEESGKKQYKAQERDDNEKRFNEASEKVEVENSVAFWEQGNNIKILKMDLKREESEARIKEALMQKETEMVSKEATRWRETESMPKDTCERKVMKGLNKVHERTEKDEKLDLPSVTKKVYAFKENGNVEYDPEDNERKSEAVMENLADERNQASSITQANSEQKVEQPRVENAVESRLLDGNVQKAGEVGIGIGQTCFNKCREHAFYQGGNKHKSMSTEMGKEWIENGGEIEADQPAVSEMRGNTKKVDELVNGKQSTVRKEKDSNETCVAEEKETGKIKRERELEQERLKKIKEEMEREREREKDRMAVDGATLEAHESACEKLERAAMERARDEARQRALIEARERLEKACAEAREMSLPMEARFRAERSAAERATAEAQESSVFEARGRIERSISDNFSRFSRNGGMQQCFSSSDLQDLHFQRASSFASSRNLNSVSGASYFAERPEGIEGESDQRCRARLERHQRTAERAAKALEEKNMRDLLALREQAERNRLSETLDAEVKRWSGGKEGNLRALISTLQYILGSDSGWQPIPLTEVITNAAVKKAYRKATLCVHPDKLQQRGASIQQKYICEKVFDLLKEAWNKFNSEEW